MDRTVRVITVLDWWGSTLGIVLVRYCCLGTSLSRNLKCILNTLLEKVQVGSMWTLKFSNSHIPGLLHTRSEAEGSSCQVIVGLFLEQPSMKKNKNHDSLEWRGYGWNTFNISRWENKLKTNLISTTDLRLVEGRGRRLMDSWRHLIWENEL